MEEAACILGSLLYDSVVGSGGIDAVAMCKCRKNVGVGYVVPMLDVSIDQRWGQ